MKNLLLLFIMFLPCSLTAQFPAPRNLQLSGSYIEVDQSDYCNGILLQGPTYCSSLIWSVPDTSISEGTIESYNIYYQETDSPNAHIVINVTDTSYTSEWGIMGSVWVTAIYREPSGESSSSNIINNAELPINIEKLKKEENKCIYYNSARRTVELKNTNSPCTINLYNINGRLLLTEKNIEILDISQLTSGIYIIELIDKDLNTTRKKIIK